MAQVDGSRDKFKRQDAQSFQHTAGFLHSIAQVVESLPPPSSVARVLVAYISTIQRALISNIRLVCKGTARHEDNNASRSANVQSRDASALRDRFQASRVAHGQGLSFFEGASYDH